MTSTSASTTPRSSTAPDTSTEDNTSTSSASQTYTPYRSTHAVTAHWAARFRAIAAHADGIPEDHALIYRAVADALDPWATARDLIPGAPSCEDVRVWRWVNQALRERRVPPEAAMPIFSVYGGTVLMHFVSWPNYDVCARALRRRGYALLPAPKMPQHDDTWAIAVPRQPHATPRA